jgi:hypothetical protein
MKANDNSQWQLKLAKASGLWPICEANDVMTNDNGDIVSS